MPDIEVELTPGRTINVGVNTPTLALASTPAVSLDVNAVVGGGGASLPTGGSLYEVLVKQSDVDGDADWQQTPSGYELAISGLIGPLILGPCAVDGSATTLTLYSVDVDVVNNSTTIPDSLFEFGTFPLGDYPSTPGANWNFVFDTIGEPADVVVIGGANAGVYRITPGQVDQPWTQLPTPLGSFCGFYLNDNTRLLMAKTATGWRTVDPVYADAAFVVYDPNTAAEAFYGTGNIYVEGALNEIGNTLATFSGQLPIWDPPDDHAVTTKVMHIDYQAGLPDASAGAWSTDNIGNLSSGVDLRAKLRFTVPTDTTDLDDAYMEFLTQTDTTKTGGDNFEAAILWAGPSFALSGLVLGRPYLFWEAAAEGASGETSAGWIEAGLKPDTWAVVRITQDFDTDTVTFWRGVPYKTTDDSEQVDGQWYHPIQSVTNTAFGSIDSGVTEDWWIGLRYTGDVAWLKMQNFARSTTYINITASGLDALTLGDTSFTDAAGNTWTTTAGEIASA